MENPEQIYDEIKQLRRQYFAEVGNTGRNTWPVSIKTRVFALLAQGNSITSVAQNTQISKVTIGYWLQYERKKANQQFHTLKVQSPKEKALTVTVNSGIPRPSRAVTVTVTTPDGYVIQGIEVSTVLDLLQRLRGK
jgi:hypothetical protein